MPTEGFGRRAGAGRKPGVPNKATAEIKALAQDYGPRCIARLAELAGIRYDCQGAIIPGSDIPAVQVSAMRELLDRGYGKAPQAITGPDGGAIHMIISGVRRAIDEAEHDEAEDITD